MAASPRQVVIVQYSDGFRGGGDHDQIPACLTDDPLATLSPLRTRRTRPRRRGRLQQSATLTDTSAFQQGDRVDTTLVTHGMLVSLTDIPVT